MSFEQSLNKLARLGVRSGVNVQPGQKLLIKAPVEAVQLVRELVREAYSAGAGLVTVLYEDEQADHESLLKADENLLVEAPDWKADLYNGLAEDKGCIIYIDGDDPDLMKDVDPAKMLKRRMNLWDKTKPYDDARDRMELSWSIIPFASEAWARKVYPDLDEKEAVEALWKDLFQVCRIDENDPVENWKKHNESFQNRIEKLNALDLASLHYEDGHGTDLVVELPEGYLFAGGGSALRNGLWTFPNIPTEEIFSAPKRDGVNGTLRTTMPLSLHGALVDGFSFVFKDGKVVDFQAETGQEILEKQLDADEGSRFLGEVALVPVGSPIEQLHRLFYNTLLDENASCHFALGQAYSECLKGAENMSREEQKEAGLNDSKIHIDFMVGSPELNITGKTRDGKEVPIFVNGAFADWLK